MTVPDRWVDAVDRAVLLLTGALVAVQGIRYLADPEPVVAATTISTASVDERHVLRAGYGGVLFAAGVLGIVGALMPRSRNLARAALLVVIGGIAGGRLVSVVVDGGPSPLLTRLLVVEATLVVLNVTSSLLRRRRLR